MSNYKERIDTIVSVLDTNKAESIEVFDLSKKNYFVDYAIIASSLGSRHTLALLDHLKKSIKPAESFNNVDESGDWVVVDLGDILIHIMTSEYRVKYDMEKFLGELASGKEGDTL
ncbi:MAG: ribosome silencing factor [Epsilonproteobacteria bacterium]|jgi:ribosome-associated protein|nr:ribosome silencing factor [Campylobacterota bacterium]